MAAPRIDAFWEGGPRPGEFYQVNQEDPMAHHANDARQATRQPIVTGTSVLAMKFDGGVIMAADCLGSYGSLARYRDMKRLAAVGDCTVVAGSGDLADFHHILHLLDDIVIENIEWNDNQKILPHSVHSYLTRVLYNRRTKMNPLWNTMVVGGVAPGGDSYLGYVDKIGVAYNDDVIATGYGSHIALPIMRSAMEEKGLMSEEEARKLMIRMLKVMYYRDKLSLNKFHIAVSTVEGVTIGEAESADTNWDIADLVKGYE